MDLFRKRCDPKRDFLWESCISIAAQFGPVTEVSLGIIPIRYKSYDLTGVQEDVGERWLKFRRQHPIGSCFVDFACVEKDVVVELAGEYHDVQYEQDRQRQAVLESEGVANNEAEDVLGKSVKAILPRTPRKSAAER